MRSKTTKRNAETIDSASTTETALRAHAHDVRVAREGASAAGGAFAGAILGIPGGPPGAIMGAVLGAAVGLTVDEMLDDASATRRAADDDLDDEIGINGGDLGAPIWVNGNPRLEPPVVQDQLVSAAAETYSRALALLGSR
jgi:hypothetical protein